MPCATLSSPRLRATYPDRRERLPRPVRQPRVGSRWSRAQNNRNPLKQQATGTRFDRVDQREQESRRSPDAEGGTSLGPRRTAPSGPRRALAGEQRALEWPRARSDDRRTQC